MLPPIPEKLSKIDGITVGEHFLLDESDECFYIWEYAARKGYAAGPTNQFIKNLKIKPSDVAKTSNRQFYEQQAIDHAANALRTLLGKRTAEGDYSFVPIPSSNFWLDAPGSRTASVKCNRSISRAGCAHMGDNAA